MIQIDGAMGEGGGQVLRTALSLSLATTQPFLIWNVRAGRPRPGLMRQHLAAVHAARSVSGAQVEGAALGSREVIFRPGPVRPGAYVFAIGSAGSTTLVLQAVLPALLVAGGPSRLELEGGTHNPAAPPWDFLATVLAPLLERMGPGLRPALERHGFYPAGGGRATLAIEPARSLARLDLLERGDVRALSVRAVVARLPARIARAECEVLARELSLRRADLETAEIADSTGPGNVATVRIRADWGTELFTGFGRRGVRAEDVAMGLAAEVREYLAADVPVGAHLADQLLVPMALAGGGSFRTTEPTGHARTAADVAALFLPVDVAFERESGHAWRVTVAARGTRAKERE
jgi:RNA 3'-terminal phosphate cyclase (ATP)